MGDPAYGYIILRPIRSRVLGDLISFVGVWLKGSRQRWGETGGWRYGEMWLMPSVGKHWHFPLERPWLASICIMRGMSQWALGGHASLGRQWGHRPVAYMVNTLRRQRFFVTSGWWYFGAGNSSFFRGIGWSTQTELRKRCSYTFYGLQKHTCNAVET